MPHRRDLYHAATDAHPENDLEPLSRLSHRNRRVNEMLAQLTSPHTNEGDRKSARANSKQQRPLSNLEVRSAAYELYRAAGGPNVELIAAQATTLLEHVLVASMENIQLLRAAQLIPVSEVQARLQEAEKAMKQATQLLQYYAEQQQLQREEEVNGSDSSLGIEANPSGIHTPFKQQSPVIPSSLLISSADRLFTSGDAGAGALSNVRVLTYPNRQTLTPDGILDPPLSNPSSLSSPRSPIQRYSGRHQQQQQHDLQPSHPMQRVSSSASKPTTTVSWAMQEEEDVCQTRNHGKPVLEQEQPLLIDPSNMTVAATRHHLHHSGVNSSSSSSGESQSVMNRNGPRLHRPRSVSFTKKC